MIRKPNAIEIEALATLKNNNSFQHVLGWLTESLVLTYDECATLHDEIALRQAQGSAQDLKEFLDLAENAVKLIKKSRR